MKFNLLKTKQIVAVSLLSCVIFICPTSSLALTVQEVPNPQKGSDVWVTDMAGILNNEIETQINQIISRLEAKNGTEMVVVTVPKISPGDTPKQFATQLFNYWGVGKKGQDNGVLFLISVGDRRVEIETGYGLEEILPDAKVGNIIKSQIIPQFKKGDFAGGTLAGTQALVVVLESERSLLTPNAENSQSTNNSILHLLLGFGGIFVLGIGGTAAYFSRKKKIFIAPSGRTRKPQGNYIVCCADCQQPMIKVDKNIFEDSLNKAEKTAQKLGSVHFEGWKCPHCSDKLINKEINIVAFTSNLPKFKQCPHCQELTVTCTKKVLIPATQENNGIRLITDQCHSCSYHSEREETIPRLPPPPPPSSSSWSSGSGGDYGGGGDFGGGSSGGGGAGDSW